MSGLPFLGVRNLLFRFGARPVLRDLTFDLRRGEVLVLFGPNGAGKTTLLRILCTLLTPGGGEVFLDGVPLHKRSERVRLRGRIGFLSHPSMLYERLTARENLQFFARMYGASDPARRCAELLEQAELRGREDDLVEEYSRGMQRRLAVARTLVHDPDLVLLDEPYSGLDPRAASRLGTHLRELARRDKAVLLTSHDLETGLSVADRVAVLWGGTLGFDAPRGTTSLERLSATYASLTGRGA
ncbi:MAG TPA: heme ABC exporter ATP-binding protein CcmA [Candidatus Polarisedimenticolia bacterium]|nr:heme ABC exporter ATP-binding protein CcmA [Candidatus Polarisedimenticolia bacterium]